MSGIRLTQSAPLKSGRTGLNIGLQVDGLDSLRTPVGLWTSEALRSVTTWAHSIEAQLSKPPDNVFQEIAVLGDGGVLIGWIGARDGYTGGYFKQLFVGGDDPSNAPLFADVNGNVTIGQNGSVTVRDAKATRVGFFGVESDATKVVVSISNATPPVVNVTAHGYATGDSVSIAGNSVSAYNTNWPITVIDANNFSLVGGTALGIGSGGTAARYYAGAWLKTEAVGGTGFADASFRVFGDGSLRIGSQAGGRIQVDAAGNVSITGATFSLNLNGVTTKLSNEVYSGVTTGLICYTTSGGLQPIYIQPGGITIGDNLSSGTKFTLTGASGNNCVMSLYDASGVEAMRISANPFGGFCDMKAASTGGSQGYRVNGSQVVGARLSAVTAPAGGTTIDTQARTAITDIINRLGPSGHGLTS